MADYVGEFKALLNEVMDHHPAVVAVVAVAVLVLVVFVFASGKPLPQIEVEVRPRESATSLSLEEAPRAETDGGMSLRDPSAPDRVQCFDPSTMQHIGDMPAMTKDEVFDVVERARVAQAEWAKTSFEQRRRVLRILLNYVVANQETICTVAARDSGKPTVDALLGEVITTCEKLRCVIAHGEQWLKPEKRPTGPLMMHKHAYVEYHPLGVLGVIAPWNYPFHNVYNHVASGLMAGNAVVFKVSEYTCWSSDYYSRILRAALVAEGHNPDLVQIVTGFAEAGQALVQSGVDKVIFTGSPQVGRRVMEGAAPSLTPVILELGGKDPFVVCDDASVDEILPMAMRGVFQNAGQNCCGAERFFVYDKVYDEFVDKAHALIQKLRQGPALQEGVDVGAMVMPAQIEIIQRLVDDARDKGARILCGGHRNTTGEMRHGVFYEPTLIADVTDDMLIAQEEVFGPVMCVVRVPDNSDEACVSMVNNSDYGLGSSVFSGNQQRAIRLGERIRAGMTTINDFGVNYLVQALPFGGVKHSGFDRFAGPEGLRACCLQKSVVVDIFSFWKTTIPKVLQYPIGGGGFLFGKSMVGLMYGNKISQKVAAIIGMMTAK